MGETQLSPAAAAKARPAAAPGLSDESLSLRVLVPEDDLVERATLRLGPAALARVAQRDQGHGQRVLGEAEQLAGLLLVTGVESGQRGADAVGAGGQHELLDGAVDRGAEPRVGRRG